VCKFCLKHGANGKWYLNAKNYLKKESEDFEQVRDYMEGLWGNMERLYMAKDKGARISKALELAASPVIGEEVRKLFDEHIEKDITQNPDPRIAEGHFGQVIPLEEAKMITMDLADVNIKAMCHCKYNHRGIKQATCLGFTAVAEMLPKLPRYIPEKGVEILDADQVESFLENMNQKGMVHTVWAGPIPYIASVCSCDHPNCIGLRMRLDFGVKAVLKGEYIALVNPNKCIGCKKCASRCQFGALHFSSVLNRPMIDAKKCFGCGLCKDSCEDNAIKLVDRNGIPITRGNY